jgi:hypothetical protein
MPSMKSAAMFFQTTDTRRTQTLARADAYFISITTPPQHQVRSLLKVGDAATLIADPSLKELLWSGLGRSGLWETVVHGTDALLKCALDEVVSSLPHRIILQL